MDRFTTIETYSTPRSFCGVCCSDLITNYDDSSTTISTSSITTATAATSCGLGSMISGYARWRWCRGTISSASIWSTCSTTFTSTIGVFIVKSVSSSTTSEPSTLTIWSRSTCSIRSFWSSNKALNTYSTMRTSCRWSH